MTEMGSVMPSMDSFLAWEEVDSYRIKQPFNEGMRKIRQEGIMKWERFSGTIISIPSEHHELLALFFHVVTDKDHLENKPVILRLHGTLGNLLDETEHHLPAVFAQAGYSSMTVNTVLANLGLFFEFGIFDKAIPQIDVAYDFLKSSATMHTAARPMRPL